jgi:hypothetical protein
MRSEDLCGRIAVLHDADAHVLMAGYAADLDDDSGYAGVREMRARRANGGASMCGWSRNQGGRLDPLRAGTSIRRCVGLAVAPYARRREAVESPKAAARGLSEAVPRPCPAHDGHLPTLAESLDFHGRMMHG